MGTENFIVYINILISSAVLIFIIWDHLKDDRLLSKQVKEFYTDIEMLIYTYIQVKYYNIIEKKEIEVSDVSALNKTRNRDIIQKSYLKTKISQNFEVYGNYIGLTIDDEEKLYLNNTIYVLFFDGLLKKRIFEDNSLVEIIKSYVDINSEEISEINKYLTSLRFYWNKNYKKLFFRPKLVQQLNFNDLLGSSIPLEKRRGRIIAKFKKKSIEG
jgi:hypothetical protein